MELANSQTTLNSFAVRMNQLERNVDALMNQSFGATSAVLGARSIMNRIATGDAVQNQNYVGPGTFDVTLAAPTTSGNFTLGRQLHLLVLGTISGITTGAGGNFTSGVVTDTSTGIGGPGAFGSWDKRNTGYVQQTTWYLALVPIGAWTVKLQVTPDNGQTFNLNFGHFDVFQLGN